MSLLNQLAQVAQLAGAKRKLPHDAETDSLGLDQAPAVLGYSNMQPYSAQLHDTQRRNQCSTHQIQQHHSLESPQASQIGPFYSEQSRTQLNDLQSTLPCRIEHVPSRSDAFSDPSASPSTERSFRGWQDAVSTTTNTSYANSPNLNSSLHVSQFGQPFAFHSHQYSPSFAGLPAHYLSTPCDQLSNARDLPIAGPLASTLASSQHRFLQGTGHPVSLDCGEAIPCSDPTCNDGIPCSGEHLPACDKADCHDAIPCPVSRLPIFESSYPHHPLDDEDCRTQVPDGGFCCSDKCPQETRCPSPCFEEDCDVPPCGVDHLAHMPWEWNHEAVAGGSESGCMDPRHMFHDSTCCGTDNVSWESSVREQLCRGLRGNDHTSEDSCSTTMCQKNLHRHDHIRDHHADSGVHGPQSIFTAQSNLQSPCCSSLKHRHQSAPRRSTREGRHMCKWVAHGDTDDTSASVCGLEFADAKELQEHVVKHVEGLQREEQLFPCRWRGCRHRGTDGFLARPKLKRHLMVHTGATPYKCDEPGCHVEMKTKDALDKHKRTHTGAKPYLCTHPNCDSRFATSTELKTHLIVHSGQKPHKCPRCGDCFADSSNLSKHKKVHEVPKFKCPDCDYKMKRWDQMRRHFKSQQHALYIIDNKEAEAEYKRQMQEAFDKLTLEERTLPLSREGSLDSKDSLRGVSYPINLKSEDDC